MRFKKLRIALEAALMVFVLIAGLIIIIGIADKASQAYTSDAPVKHFSIDSPSGSQIAPTDSQLPSEPAATPAVSEPIPPDYGSGYLGPPVRTGAS